MRRKLSIPTATLLGLIGLAFTAHAAERVTLRNGFAMQCAHHAQVDGRIRLFPNAGDESYIEFVPEDIVAYEQVPDPPPAPPEPSLVASQPQQISPPSAQDAHLSPDDLREMLSKASHEHNLDVDLLASIVKAESGGNARAVSRAGARGLMQLMPATATSLGVEDSFEPEQNVRGGSAYLDALLTDYHDNLALALAAYNAGPAAVARFHGVPPYRETRAYIACVIHEFNRRVRTRQAQARQLPSRQTIASASSPQAPSGQ
jgi:hypothetical protein